MTGKLAEIIDYLIGAGVMTYMLFVVKRKSAEQPLMKISGLSIKTIITIIYVGLSLDILLIIAILTGLTKY